MSRICVKNLPKYVSEDRLREYFSQKGEITDAKIMRTVHGKSRQFAFIGYGSELQAQEAIKYFDRSFVDSSRIQCEIAHKVGDPNIPRPWSRYSVKTGDKSRNVTNPTDADVLLSSDLNGKGKKASKTNDKEDPELQEFLQVMQPRSNTKLWEDDVPQTISTDKYKLNGSKKDLINMTVKNTQGSCADATTANESQDEPQDSKAVKTTKKLVLDYAVSDMDYFKSRMKIDWSDSESSDDETGASDGSPVHNEDKVLQTDRLFIRNLPYAAIEDEIEEHFSKIGKVSQVHLVLDKQTKRSKGFAYVQYSSPDFAARALKELDGESFQGRLLHVLPAEQKISPDKEETIPNRVKNFKERRGEERKASEASGNTKAWNPFFVRPDTVVENIARRFGVSKSDVLDPELDDIAVRIALGETQVIAETKNALKNAGINVVALEKLANGRSQGVKRSNRVIIVKNLPYVASEGQLAQMFGKFGSPDKIILPSTKSMAVVVFLGPSEASAAFRGLAYTRYEDAPLYLEWAPIDVLDGSISSNDGGTDSTVVGVRDVKKQLVEDETSYMDIDPDRVESRSLFVKNLNFKTTEDSLRQHFTGNLKEGKIWSVKIKKPVKNGKNLSMGYGFIEFDSVDTATRTCKDLQETVLDGHKLNLQLCHAKRDEKAPGKADKNKSPTKILVRNVAFELKEKDLRDLFSPYGQIKCLRMPKRFGKHRGFAFIEFLTKQETQNALQALSSTHILGRRLRLEGAKEAETLKELRRRTAAQFTNAQKGFQTNFSKKRKHTDILDEDDMEFD